jgi:hypothetical protein
MWGRNWLHLSDLTNRKETPPFSPAGPHIRRGLLDPSSFQKLLFRIMFHSSGFYYISGDPSLLDISKMWGPSLLAAFIQALAWPKIRILFGGWTGITRGEILRPPVGIVVSQNKLFRYKEIWDVLNIKSMVLGPNRRTPKLRVTPGSTPRIYYITEGV